MERNSCKNHYGGQETGILGADPRQAPALHVGVV